VPRCQWTYSRDYPFIAAELAHLLHLGCLNFHNSFERPKRTLCGLNDGGAHQGRHRFAAIDVARHLSLSQVMVGKPELFHRICESTL
jgi:hypothetical protein